MADTILELMTRVNVEPLKSAMTEAAASVSSSTQKMKSDLSSFSSTSMAANQGVQAVMRQLPPEFIKVEAGGVFAFEQIKRRVIEATSEVGALRQEILGTNDAAKLEQLNAQLDQARARMTAARTEMRAMRMETTETREKADLLGDSMGIRLPGALGRLLGQMPLLQSAMNAAFAPILVLFFAEAIERMAGSIAKAAQEWGGWGEAAQKAYQEALEHNTKMITATLDLAEKQRAVAAVGKEGAAKYAIETKNAQEAAKAQAAELGRLGKELIKVNDEVTALTKKTASGEVFIGFDKKGDFSFWRDYSNQLKEAQEQARRLRGELDPLEEKLRNRTPEVATKGAEETSRQGEEARAVQRANTDAQKNLQTEYVNFYEQGLRRMYTAEKITLEDEVSGERAAIQGRLEIERNYAAQRKAQLAAEHQATGKDVAPQVTGVNEQLAAAEVRTRSEIAAIDQRYDIEKLQQTNAVNLATVQAAKSTADAEITVIEETSRRRFESGQIIVSELTAIEKSAANQRIDEQRSVVQEQLKAAQEFPEKNKALIIKLNAELENLERERITKIDAIDREAENRADQVRAIEAEAEKAHQQNLLEIARLGIQTRANLGLIGNRERVSQLQAITAQEFNLEREAIEKKRALYAQGTTQYEQAEKELQQINDKYSKQMAEDEANALKSRFAQWQKFDRQIEDGFAGAVGQMIRGQKTFGQALAEVWTGMVVDFAQMLTKWVVQWTLQHTAMQVISKIFHVKELAEQLAERTAKTTADTAATTAQVAKTAVANAAMTTSDAGYTAAHVAAATVRSAADLTSIGATLVPTLLTNVALVTSEAGVAGAAGFASVMAALPFPANIATAPGVMAAAIGLTLSNLTLASAAGGMDVTHDQVLFAHKDEKVLPAGFSRDLTAAVGGAGFTGIGIPKIAAALSSMGGGVTSLQGQVAALHGSPSSSSTDNSSRSQSTGGHTYKTTSAAGGMDVKADQIAMIHKNEMVLPESIAKNFRGPSMPGSPSGLTPGLAMSTASAITSGANTVQGSMAALSSRAGGPSDLSRSMAALHSGASGSSSAGAGTSANSGGAGNGGDTYKTMHNHMRFEIHNHGDAKMSQDELIAGVRRGVRSGHLKFGDS